MVPDSFSAIIPDSTLACLSIERVNYPHLEKVNYPTIFLPITMFILYTLTLIHDTGSTNSKFNLCLTNLV